jgi:hypothetical protein
MKRVHLKFSKAMTHPLRNFFWQNVLARSGGADVNALKLENNKATQCENLKYPH